MIRQILRWFQFFYLILSNWQARATISFVQYTHENRDRIETGSDKLLDICYYRINPSMPYLIGGQKVTYGLVCVDEPTTIGGVVVAYIFFLSFFLFFLFLSYWKVLCGWAESVADWETRIHCRRRRRSWALARAWSSCSTRSTSATWRASWWHTASASTWWRSPGRARSRCSSPTPTTTLPSWEISRLQQVCFVLFAESLISNLSTVRHVCVQCYISVFSVVICVA